MPLSELQVSSLSALEWLFDVGEEYRRTGRSFLLALALVRIGLRNPGRWVSYFDHTESMENVSRRRDEHVRDLIVRLVRVSPFEGRFEMNGRISFRFNLHQPQDWLPPESWFAQQGPEPLGPGEVNRIINRTMASPLTRAPLQGFTRIAVTPEKPIVGPSVWDLLNAED